MVTLPYPTGGVIASATRDLPHKPVRFKKSHNSFTFRSSETVNYFRKQVVAYPNPPFTCTFADDYHQYKLDLERKLRDLERAKEGYEIVRQRALAAWEKSRLRTQKLYAQVVSTP